MPGYCGLTFEKSRSGPGVSPAASSEKCGNAQTGMLKIVRSGLSPERRWASRTASLFVHTTSRARTTSCPAFSRAPAITPSTSRQNFSTSSWTKSRPSENVRIPTFATICLPLSKRPSRRSRAPELEVEDQAPRSFSLTADPLQQELHRAVGHLAHRLGQRRERRFDELGPERIVHGNERHLLRHPYPVSSQHLERPDSHEVVAYDEGREITGLEQLLGGRSAVRNPVSAGGRARLDPGFAHRSLVPELPFDAGLDVVQPAHEADTFVSGPDQKLRRQP